MKENKKRMLALGGMVVVVSVSWAALMVDERVNHEAVANFYQGQTPDGNFTINDFTDPANHQTVVRIYQSGDKGFFGKFIEGNFYGDQEHALVQVGFCGEDADRPKDCSVADFAYVAYDGSPTVAWSWNTPPRNPNPLPPMSDERVKLAKQQLEAVFPARLTSQSPVRSTRYKKTPPPLSLGGLERPIIPVNPLQRFHSSSK